MRKTKEFYDIKVDHKQYGFCGRIEVTSVLESDPKHSYPLCELAKNA